MLDGATAQLILIKLSLFPHWVNEMKKGIGANEAREGEREGEKDAIKNDMNSAGTGEA